MKRSKRFLSLCMVMVLSAFLFAPVPGAKAVHLVEGPEDSGAWEMVADNGELDEDSARDGGPGGVGDSGKVIKATGYSMDFSRFYLLMGIVAALLALAGLYAGKSAAIREKRQRVRAAR